MRASTRQVARVLSRNASSSLAARSTFYTVDCGVSLVVREEPTSVVRRLIETNHYSGKTTKNVWRSFGVYYEDRLEGAIQIGYGIRPKMKTHLFDGPPEAVREFDRMYLTDLLPPNAESAVIGGLLRYLKRTYPEVAVLITYADGIRGKVGTIYQATNAIYIGAVAGEFYFLPSGEAVHPVTMWHWHKTRKREVLNKLYPGIKHIRGAQHRYIYILDPTWRSRLKVPIQPYPKHNV